jgi:hypothetical protein
MNFKLENSEPLLFDLAGFNNGGRLGESDPSGFSSRADANGLTRIAPAV